MINHSRKRSTPITIILVLMGVSSFMFSLFSVLFYFALPNHVSQVVRNMKLINVVIGVVIFLSVYKIIKWKKWGCYSLISVLVVNLFLMIKLGIPYFILIPFYLLISIGLVLLIKPIWIYLE